MQTWILVLLFRITTLNMRRILLNKVHHYGVRGIMMAGFLHIYCVVNKQHKLVLKIFLKEINKNLSWKNYLVHLASKISKAIGIIARLRHFVPLATPSYFTSHMHISCPALSIVWHSHEGLSRQSHGSTILILQDRARRMMYFGE